MNHIYTSIRVLRLTFSIRKIKNDRLEGIVWRMDIYLIINSKMDDRSISAATKWKIWYMKTETPQSFTGNQLGTVRCKDTLSQFHRNQEAGNFARFRSYHNHIHIKQVSIRLLGIWDTMIS